MSALPAARVRASRRGLLAAGCLALAVALLVVLPAGRGSALNQYCGPDATGISLGGYPGGTRANGHPIPGRADSGWSGLGAIGIAKDADLAANRVSATIDMLAKLYDAGVYGSGEQAVKLAYTIAGVAAGIVESTTSATVLALEQRAAEMDACGAVLEGDTIDLLFVATMENDLANFDPKNGSHKAPTSLFMLPDDGLPNWTQFATKYTDRPGHSDLAIPYQDGFIDAESVGVATVVRNTIAHLEAHGISTGGGFVWDPEKGWVKTDGAKDLWWDGIHLLQDGRVELAYTKFAEAYRMAVSAPTSN